ncbi:formylglycine-generating enzyme family protein [Bacillus sp. Marseille-P3661]|uniref:formylglycine-generating enzyme family protein n=1 Tax=Bacillus sp. Marseille-P3661 TaxID=1936234 RepID=UPI000C834E02|nr:formylglycine-generating enzyme family protein [Bacillus sp. Marseille-P3661]
MTNEKACCAARRNSNPLIIETKAKQELHDAISIPLKNKSSYDGMVYLEGGPFLMGTDDGLGFPEDGEGPVREVTIDPFYIDTCAVTNQQFLEFTKNTGYKTESELFGWSFVFHHFVDSQKAELINGSVPQTPWWLPVKEAYWFQPEGKGSNIEDRMDHPVVHISWNDAIAYCNWAGKRLPTEAEWEYAARGGLVQKQFPWGDELTPNGEHLCNVWQGKFPQVNTALDGYAGTAPVTAYQPNGYGLYNVSGNVWEWCADWFSPNFHINGPRNNPGGPDGGSMKVMRGGSYLCHKSYCNRYRVAARSKNTPDSASGNIGFRCVKD